jgi:hypothetical protein
MPTPRKYANNAERQTAYRARRPLPSHSQSKSQKSTTGDSHVSPRLSYRRWDAMIEQSLSLIRTVKEEMQLYYDQRTDRWQESERGGKHAETMETIEEIVYLMQDLSHTESEA